MILPFPAIDAAFKASTSRDSVAILFLIEDSSLMSTLWPRVRDFYLSKVLGAIKDANPSVPIQVLWMPASQLSPIDSRSSSATSRRSPRWNDIPAFEFSPHSNSKISPTAVSCAIDTLASAFGRTQAIRHLVLIAASNFAGDSSLRPSIWSWIPIVHKLNQEDTLLHMIVRSQQNMDTLASLFWEAAKHDLYTPSVTDDTHYTFYLRNQADSSHQIAPQNSAPQSDCPPSVRSRESISTTPTSSRTSSSTSSLNRPSLVFQLQKMNGMEKKRRSRVRRDPPTVSKLSKPYQKTYPNTSLIPHSESFPERLTATNLSGHTVCDVPSRHSGETSSEDNASYSTTTSPARSLSPSSPRYSRDNAMTSSSQLPPEHSSFHHSNAISNTIRPSYDVLRSPASSSRNDSISSASFVYDSPRYHQGMPFGAIKSHFPQPKTLPSHMTMLSNDSYGEASIWRRDSSVSEYYFQPGYPPGQDNPNASSAESPFESSCIPQDSPLMENTDYALYSAYSTTQGYYYASRDYDPPNVEVPSYLSMHSSSLNPAQVYYR